MEDISAQQNASWRGLTIWLAASAGLIFLYFVLVVLLAPGAPFMDDIHISESVERARASANPWPELWSQHNEHRPVITKIIFWMQRAVAAPDYTLLAFIGNLSLLPIFAIFVQRARTLTGVAAGAAILFVATMTFSYTSADSMLWAMTAMSNYGVIVFALLAFWMLGKGGAAWSLGALAAALLAGLSQGNGFLVLLLGCAFLVLDRRWLLAAAWIAATFAFMALYFLSYTSVAGNADPIASLGRPHDVLLFGLIFSGSAFGYPLESEPLAFAMMVACAVLGLLLWAFVLRMFIAARFRSTDPLLWFSVFLIASGCLAALSRLDTGFIQAMTPRYHVNSCLLIASCVLVMATRNDGAKLTIGVRRFMPLLGAVGLAYIAVSTLTLWRMHTFYIEQTQGLPPPA